MSLEGLRAWIGEVERKLGKRTRVFLALTVIAIGIAAASLYLAIDTRNSSVSESDVQALQQKLETRIDEAAAGGAATPPCHRSKPNRRRRHSPKNRSRSPTAAARSRTRAPPAASRTKARRILELLERAKKQNAEAGAK